VTVKHEVEETMTFTFEHLMRLCQLNIPYLACSRNVQVIRISTKLQAGKIPTGEWIAVTFTLPFSPMVLSMDSTMSMMNSTELCPNSRKPGSVILTFVEISSYQTLITAGMT
jgi:hypothetical protein